MRYWHMDKSNILITGANSQIGSYLAQHYHALGHPLTLWYHQRDERIRHLDLPKSSLDLRDYDAVQTAFYQMQIPPQVLIHCAAVRSSDSQPLADTQPATFQKVFDSNFYPAYNLLKTVLPAMRQAEYGRIILFTSDVSRSGLAFGSAYAASKAAIANLAKSAALENARYNVLINCLAPGPVESNLAEDYTGEYLEFRRDYFQRHLQQSCSGVLISKAEICATVDYLIHPHLRNMIGEQIFLSGGKA